MKTNSPPRPSVRRAPLLWLLLMFCLGAPPAHGQLNQLPVTTIFLIVMENLSWSAVRGNPAAPYINHTLLPMASYCTQYYSSPTPHPSEPNYIWLESGTNFGLTANGDPYADHINSTNHLVTLLNNAGLDWRAYQEDISGLVVPLDPEGGYVPRHNPFVFFDDVTGTNNANYPYGIAHIRPFTELAADLANNNVAAYNFITPDLCDDMHDACPPTYNALAQGDAWLAAQIPMILNSAAYQAGGVIFITWDESSLFESAPIGMIVLSPFARGGGYAGAQHYTHSSTLRTIQEFLGVTPFLGDAANAPDLIDLFAVLRVAGGPGPANAGFQLTVTGAVPGMHQLIQRSTDLKNWTTLADWVADAANYHFLDRWHPTPVGHYYRVVQTP